MSNYQQGFDRMRDKDRLNPRENARDDKEAMAQHEAEQDQPQNDEQWIPPGNKDQGSRKD